MLRERRVSNSTKLSAFVLYWRIETNNVFIDHLWMQNAVSPNAILGSATSGCNVDGIHMNSAQVRCCRTPIHRCFDLLNEGSMDVTHDIE
jgi:hypothetical protein